MSIAAAHRGVPHLSLESRLVCLVFASGSGCNKATGLQVPAGECATRYSRVIAYLVPAVGARGKNVICSSLTICNLEGSIRTRLV